MESINEIKRDTLGALILQGKRGDGREMFDYRKINVQSGILQNPEGSSVVSIGKSQVMAGIKFDIAKPFPDRPKEGVLSTSADLLPLASHLFETGPPSDESIELARGLELAKNASAKIREVQMEAIKKVYDEPKEDRFLIIE